MTTSFESPSLKSSPSLLYSKGKLNEIIASFDKQTSSSRKTDSRFLYRFNTFSILTWFGKPGSISPKVCAERGWINVGVSKIKCSDCSVELDAAYIKDPLAEVAEFEDCLINAHAEGCFWKGLHPLPDRYQPLTKKVIQERMLAWQSLIEQPPLALESFSKSDGGISNGHENLPSVHLDNLDAFTTSFFGNSSTSAESIKVKILALCLLNWAPALDGNGAHCQECNRVVLFANISNPQRFDVLKEHRHFCRIRTSSLWLPLARQ